MQHIDKKWPYQHHTHLRALTHCGQVVNSLESSTEELFEKCAGTTQDTYNWCDICILMYFSDRAERKENETSRQE